MENLFTIENGIGFIALAAMEIVLGIDNIVFLSIIASRLPVAQQAAARKVGLALALILRLALLFTISHLVQLVEPLFTWTSLGVPAEWIAAIAHKGDPEHFNNLVGVSWRDLILLGGGLFLIAKSVLEIHEKVEGIKSGAFG